MSKLLDISIQTPARYPTTNVSIIKDTITFDKVDFNLNNIDNDKIYLPNDNILDIEDFSIIFSFNEEIKNIKFSNCLFNCNVKIIIKKVSLVIDTCQMNKKIEFGASIFNKFKIRHTKFKELVDFSENIFFNDTNFYKTTFEKEVVLSNTGNKIRINKDISFSMCKFHDILYFENISLNKNSDVTFYRSIFSEIVLLKNNKFKDNSISFRDVQFKNVVYFNNSIFGIIDFNNTIFNKKAIFIDTKFKKYLDLRTAMFDDEANFLDIEIDKIENRETARIIKHNFEKIGNKIEANKFHALELEQQQTALQNIECKSLSEIRDYIVFTIHGISSNHSTNWFRAFGLILLVGLITYLSIDTCVCPRHNCTSNWIDYFKYISIINLDNCIKYNPLIFVLNKASLGYLYYQFLLSVRKDTRK